MFGAEQSAPPRVVVVFSSFISVALKRLVVFDAAASKRPGAPLRGGSEIRGRASLLLTMLSG